MVSQKVGSHAQELTKSVGWVSVGAGLPLTFTPHRSAALLGWGDRALLARLVGVGDLAVGAGLLVDHHRSRWMLARALLNVAIAAGCARVLAEGTPRRGRVIGEIGLMSFLTVADYFRMRRLPKIGA